ncbi:MAG: hypothetical protein LBV21_05710 [Candidatus Adiutrix sp.]|jgi:hypothetical protein|nr:hypothetical protein [Candidatus Adiutrix sp.]
MAIDRLPANKLNLEGAAEPRAIGAPAAPPEGGVSMPSPEEGLAARGRFPQAGLEVLRGGPITPAETAAPAAPPLPGGGVMALPLLGRANVLMPTAGLREPAEQIPALVRTGRLVYQNIRESGPPPRSAPPRLDSANVNALMWFLQAQGSAKAAASAGLAGPVLFREGAFQIEDPDHNLENWLKSGPDSYSRSSSHLRDFQAEGEAYKPRGLDVRGEATPNERRTILFQRLPSRAEPGPADGRDAYELARLDRPMLVLKMEPHGCRGLGFHGGRPGEAADGISDRIKNFFSNLGDWLGHAGGFFGTLLRGVGLQSAGRNNRERLPADLTRDYRALLKQAEDLSEAKGFDYNMWLRERLQLPYCLENLTQGQPLSDSGGVRVMRENIRGILGFDDNAGPNAKMPGELRRNLEEFMTKTDNFDHPEMRIGREVILTSADLAPAHPAGGEG